VSVVILAIVPTTAYRHGTGRGCGRGERWAVESVAAAAAASPESV